MQGFSLLLNASEAIVALLWMKPCDSLSESDPATARMKGDPSYI